MDRTLLLALFVSCSLALPAQNATPSVPAEASRPNIVFPRERVQNLGQLKNEIKSYHECTCTCGCYETEIEEQADRAIQFLRERTQHLAPGERPAVVFDVDETALSNYSHLVESDFGYNAANWDQWVQKAQAPAIPGTLRLFQEAQKLHVAVFFITGRPTSEGPATEKNLRMAGYQTWDGLILRPAQPAKTVEYKSAARKSIQDQGFRIILNVGDQLSDLAGNPSFSALRRKWRTRSAISSTRSRSGGRRSGTTLRR